MKINKYFPFAFIYFFVNSVALPFGLTYMALLAPLFYVWILLTRKKELLFPFIAFLLPFVLIQIFVVGVELKSYSLSFLNLVLLYIFCQAVYTFLKICPDPEKIFRKLLIINFILCLIAIVIYFTPYYNLLWIEQRLTQGVSRFRRLKLFTYEASYYAILFVPLFLFYLLQYFFRQNTIKSKRLLIMLFLPLALSFSIGVIGALLAAGLLTFILYFRRLAPKRRIVNAFVSVGVFLGVGLTIVVLFFRHNPIFLRIGNIFAGDDSSGSGRTSDAFILAGKLLHEKSEYWGIGIGQIKIIGGDIIRSYYLYRPDYVVAIPNAAAETLVTFGWIGLVLRIFVEFFLFFYTKVWTNYYRLILFLFIFVYQFAGSFITNSAEYVIWILAFTNVFKQFDVNARSEGRNNLVVANS